MRPPSKPARRGLLVLALLTLCLQTGCNGCWDIDGGPGCDWDSGCGEMSSCGGDGDAALAVVYAAIIIPYLIVEACRGCR